MSESESKFIIQRMIDIPEPDRAAMLDQVVAVEKEAWPAEIQAPREKFEDRARIFSEGFLMISLPDLGLVGVSTSEIIDYDPQHPPISWEGITDNGTIGSTHNPLGNALYLVSVGASPRAKGRGVGTALVREQIEFAKGRGLSYLVLGSRIPGFAAYHSTHQEFSIEEYVSQVRADNLPADPELRFYTRCGLSIAKIVPNYMEDDPESGNYGAVMVWKNPLKT